MNGTMEESGISAKLSAKSTSVTHLTFEPKAAHRNNPSPEPRQDKNGLLKHTAPGLREPVNGFGEWQYDEATNGDENEEGSLRKQSSVSVFREVAELWR